jgi:uncharacterized membrane protein
MIAVGCVFFLAMLLLMPRINAVRDASLADDGAESGKPAAKRFASLHRLSVVINFAQMLTVLVVLVRLLA